MNMRNMRICVLFGLNVHESGHLSSLSHSLTRIVTGRAVGALETRAPAERRASAERVMEEAGEAHTMPKVAHRLALLFFLGRAAPGCGR